VHSSLLEKEPGEEKTIQQNAGTITPEEKKKGGTAARSRKERRTEKKEK